MLFLPNPHRHCPFSPFCWSCLRETYGDICQSILPPNIGILPQPSHPTTAATFNILEHFHLLTFELKALVFVFLHVLMCRTNNIDIMDVLVSLSYYHIKYIKCMMMQTQGLLWWISSNDLWMVTLENAQASTVWARSCGCIVHYWRWVCSPLPCMSTARQEFAR